MDGERVLKWQARADTREFALFMSLGCESLLSQTLVTSPRLWRVHLEHGFGLWCFRCQSSHVLQFTQKSCLHIIGRFNDKWLKESQDQRNGFKLKHETLQSPATPFLSFHSRPQTPVCLHTTSARCVTAAVVEKLCPLGQRVSSLPPYDGPFGHLCKSLAVQNAVKQHLLAHIMSFTFKINSYRYTVKLYH